MLTPINTAITLWLLLLVCSRISAGAEVYEWTDESGAVVFSDDPAKVPAKIRKRAKRFEGESPKTSWIRILDNRSGYIYKSFAFYDESKVKRISSIEWVVQVKLIIDDRGRRRIGPTSYYEQQYRLVCSPRSIMRLKNQIVDTEEDQMPVEYQNASAGVTDHESLIPDQLLNIFCGRYPDPFDPVEETGGYTTEGRKNL